MATSNDAHRVDAGVVTNPGVQLGEPRFLLVTQALPGGPWW